MDGETAGPRRWGLPLLIGLLFLVVGLGSAACGLSGWRALTKSSYARGYAAVLASEADIAEATTEQRSALSAAEDAVVQAQGVLDSAPAEYALEVDATTLRQATAELATMTSALRPTAEPPGSTLDPPSAADGAPWELGFDAMRMRGLAAANSDLVVEAGAETEELRRAESRLARANETLFENVAVAADEQLALNGSASYRSRIGLKSAVTQSEAGSGRTADGLLAIVAAIEAVRMSHIEEEAEKLDLSYPVRAEIEAYARSIAGGVTLDFDWQPEVNGLGAGWLSGTAEFWPTDGGWGIINLNDTVASGWNDGDNARALVAHEVGHTQVVRDSCRALFAGPEFAGDHEIWATAWSISLGFDVPGSGIQAYGRPTDAQIATAGQCR
ncbi:hypothetical protein [Luethyella okanaganae]|uniref:Uncharacterized protein n=1 Tax=Luethyella okanaganae TaxID=69372 RepID=A0ABW1VGB3_9MICO